MAANTKKSESYASKDNGFRLPWALKIAGVGAIAVPLTMIVHVAHTDMQSMRYDVVTLEAENAEIIPVAKKLQVEVVGLRADLADEQLVRRSLEGKIAALGDQVAVLRKRESSLHGIIDLLEGEVIAVERRLEKLAVNSPGANVNLTGLGAAALVASGDPQLRNENNRMRNELGKHDEQVAELLGEIGILNQELEIMRGERGQLQAQVSELNIEVDRTRAAMKHGAKSVDLAGLLDENN